MTTYRQLPSRRWTALGVLVLLALAVPPRLVRLSALGFFGDEETTALAARSLAETGTARMPSGMAYRRALPYTWLNAAIAGQAGIERESSYRIGSAAFGALAPATLFVVGVTFVGAAPAFVGGLLLAVSEWHVVFSRMARMYVPFAFFYLLAAGSLWLWATTARWKFALAGAVSFGMAVSLHALGIFAIQFALLPLVFGTAAVSAPVLLGAAAGGAGVAWAYDRLFVVAPYQSWPALSGAQALAETDVSPIIPTGSPVVFLAAAVAAAAFITRRIARTTPSPESDFPRGIPGLALSLLAGLIVGFTVLGQLAAAGALLIVGLLIDRPGFTRLVVRERAWTLSAVAIGGAWLVAMVAIRGPAEGVKAVSYFPYPYSLTLLRQQPVIVLLAAVTVLHAIFRDSDNVPLRSAAVSVLLPVLALGAVSRWGAPRYLFHLDPFVLLLAGAGLYGSLAWLVAWAGMGKRKTRELALGIASMLALSGILGQHGLRQVVEVATLGFGEPTSRETHLTALRPDHAGPGRFVREHASEGDVIVAVDVLEQAWYVGRVDYWLRAEPDAAPFLYPKDGELRDIYVSARLLRSRTEMERIIAEARGRIWLTTSAEIASDDRRAISDEQRDLLEWVARDWQEVFVGRDGITRVFCLDCDPALGSDSSGRR